MPPNRPPSRPRTGNRSRSANRRPATGRTQTPARTHRSSNRSGQSDNLLENNQIQQPEQVRPTVDSIEYSNLISNDLNAEVHNLRAGIKHLLNFQLSAETEQPELFAVNKQKIDQLIHSDLPESYKNLDITIKKRNQFYESLVRDRVILQPDLDIILGRISNEPYTNLINSIQSATIPPATTPPTPNARQALDDDDVRNLKAATSAHALAPLLTQLQADHKITPAQSTQLSNLAPKTEQEITQARDQIFIKIHQHDIAHNTHNLDKYKQLISNEKLYTEEINAFIEQYNKTRQEIVKEIQKIYDQEEEKMNRQRKISEISLESGLPIKKGSVLYGEDWSFEPLNQDIERPRNKRLEIIDITFGEADADPSLDPEFLGKMPTLEPVVKFLFEAQDNSGRMIERSMDKSQFMKFLASNNICQKIDLHSDLEKELNLTNDLKPGQVLEFQEIKPNPTAQEGDDQFTIIDKSVTIVSIEADGIVLNEEVYIDKPNNGAGLSQGRKSKKLSFADFARWYRKAEVLPQMKSLDHLNQHLDKFNNKLADEMGWKPNPNQPINLKGSLPVRLIPAFQPFEPDQFLEITDANDQKITASNGDSFTPSQFLRQAHQNGWITPTRDQLQEISDHLNQTEQQEKAKRVDEIISKYAPPAVSQAAKSTDTPKSAKSDKPGFFDQLKGAWKRTTFLNLKEIFDLFWKTPLDRIKEKLKDSSERAVATVGHEFYKGVPFIGAALSNKFLGVINSKNADDIKKKKENWENEGKTLQEIIKILYSTGDKKEFKAALEVVAPKGILRFSDDKNFHDSINRLFPNNKYTDKYPEINGETIVVGEQSPKAKNVIFVSTEDQMKMIFDKEFSEGFYDRVNRENDGAYGTRKKEYAEKFRNAEFFGGGIKNKLMSMISDFVTGKNPVDPAQFEGYMESAIAKNELDPAQDVFFFIAAFGARKEGYPNELLIPINKYNDYIGTFRENPIFKYFAYKYPQYDDSGKLIEDNGKPRRGHLGANEFKKLFDDIIAPDIEKNKSEGKPLYQANSNTQRWILGTILTTEDIEKTMSQNLRTVDPRLYHYCGPLLYNEGEINGIVTSGNSNSRENFDILQNMYVGYNSHLLLRSQRLRNVPEKTERSLRIKQLSNLLGGFIYYDDALNGRISSDRQNISYNQFTQTHFKNRANADKSLTVGEFNQENKKFAETFIKGLASLSGNPDIGIMAEKLFQRNEVFSIEEEREFRAKVKSVLEELGDSNYDAVVNLAELSSQSLTGMTGQVSEKPKE